MNDGLERSRRVTETDRWRRRNRRMIISQHIRHGCVFCDYRDMEGRRRQHLEDRKWAVFDEVQKCWMPKMQYCLKYLGGRQITKELRRRVTNDFSELFESKQAVDNYKTLLEALVMVADDVSKTQQTSRN